ncbi:MAG: zf-HC2 domain-containing protein [Nitrospirae bacterium]|nr:zf-HC2 domain-containing protein [Nitrospirota bacterium]
MTREEINIYVLDYLAGRLTCKEWVEMVTNYLEGALSLWQRIRFHLHLGLCKGCRHYLQQMRVSIKAARMLPREAAPAHVREELIRRFRSMNPS